MYIEVVKNQAQFFKKPYKPTKKWLFRISKAVLNSEVCSDPKAYIDSLPKIKKKILNFLFEFHRTYPGVAYFSLFTLAKKVGCHVTYAGDSMREFEAMGFFVSYQRWNDSKWYKFCSQFSNPNFFKNVMAYLSLSMLMIAQGSLRENASLNVISNNEVINRIVIRESLSSARYACATGAPTREAKKRGEVNMSIQPFSTATMQLKNINLTEAGRCKIAAFPDDAIRYADDKLKNRTLTNPMAFFMKICKSYCSEHNITPLWEKTRFLMQSYGFDDSTPELEKKQPTTGRPQPSSKFENHVRSPETENRIAQASLSLMEKEREKMRAKQNEWNKANLGIEVEWPEKRTFQGVEQEAKNWEEYKNPFNKFHDIFTKLQQRNGEEFKNPYGESNEDIRTVRPTNTPEESTPWQRQDLGFPETS